MSFTSTSSRPVIRVDALDQSRRPAAGVEVVHLHGDALAAGLGHELGRLLDRLRAVHLRAPLARGPARAVDGRARLAERHRDAAPAAARGARHQRHRARASGPLTPAPPPPPRAAAGSRARAPPTITSMPPSSWSGPRTSPKTRNARITVTTGSAVERIAALEGPTRFRPAKNRLTATTVDTTARLSSQPHPAAVTAPGSRSPIRAVPGGERHGRAGADERRQDHRRHPPGDALAREDVGRVDRGRRQRERRAHRIERARLGVREHEHQSARTPAAAP